MLSRSASVPGRASRGFTLVELMITLLVLAAVVLALTTVLRTAGRSKTASANYIEASQAGRVALDMIARDLRSAGYGADLDYLASPQPPIAYIDATQVLINANLQPFPDTASAGHAGPLAYNPAGTPRPRPIDGTSWQPPVRYRTGAEIVRWTLDLNDDGTLDAGDVANANGVDAARTRNPNDFELVRQVYGDSTNNSSGNNGGMTQRVALIRPPGGGVPPIFTVYLRGSSTPYDWAGGPLPASELRNIERITVQITAPSGKPDWRGAYTESHFRTDVNSMRNTPDFGAPEYGVDGYVFHDVNRDHVRDGGDVGLGGVQVHLGMYSVSTASNGYFLFSAPAGTYTLRHDPPAGYGIFSNPDSFVVTVGPPQTRSFADTLRTGGWVRAFVWNDEDHDGQVDTDERPRDRVRLTLNPGGAIAYTDTAGNARMFAGVGGWSVTVTPPDSFTVSTPNPVTGTMLNGDSAAVRFGVYHALIGTVRGTVFRDANRNGVLDSGEQGIQGVWVGVTPDGGVTVPGYAYTDANGAYSIDAPVNDPPRTQPYSVMCIAPDGYFPTSSMSINNVWLQDAQILTDRNFGVAAFQVITLNANRVLSLVSADLIERDWIGSHTENAVKDRDIILGSDANGTDQVSVWFNQYNSTPLFTANPTYARSAPNAVLAMAIDTLDATSPTARPDLVTGTRAAAAGNFFVWFNQNSNNNEGYFPSAYSPGQAYRTQDNGDVQALLTLDCVGASAAADGPDLIVGTKSATALQGSVEIWRNGGGATPVFSREEVYPPAGGFVAGSMGEVTSLTAADLDGDGRKDLVVTTRTGSATGQIFFLKGLSRITRPHFQYIAGWSFGNDALTSATVTDVDGDGAPDLVVGTETNSGSGRLYYLRNSSPLTFGFNLQRSVNAPGIVVSLMSADLGGGPRADIAAGWRQNSTSYVGGVRIYFTDSGTLPSTGVDPSAGAVVNFVPAMTANHFNYGVNPPFTGTLLTDLAVGVKVSSTTGALVVFIR